MISSDFPAADDEILNLKHETRNFTDKTLLLKQKLQQDQQELSLLIYSFNNLQFYKQQLVQDLTHCQQFQTIYNTDIEYRSSLDLSMQHSDIIKFLEDELSERNRLASELKEKNMRVENLRERLLEIHSQMVDFDKGFAQMGSSCKNVLLNQLFQNVQSLLDLLASQKQRHVE